MKTKAGHVWIAKASPNQASARKAATAQRTGPLATAAWRRKGSAFRGEPISMPCASVREVSTSVSAKRGLSGRARSLPARVCSSLSSRAGFSAELISVDEISRPARSPSARIRGSLASRRPSSTMRPSPCPIGWLWPLRIVELREPDGSRLSVSPRLDQDGTPPIGSKLSLLRRAPVSSRTSRSRFASISYTCSIALWDRPPLVRVRPERERRLRRDRPRHRGGRPLPVR